MARHQREPRVPRPVCTACGLAMLVCACSLSGCVDEYEMTCVWHSDLLIKGCSFFDFRSCIQHCTYCVKDTGPDECGQLKCAAYCAKQEGEGECLTNFKTLCEIAVQEQETVNGCDVDCSSAPRRAGLRPGLALLLAGLHVVLFRDLGPATARLHGLPLACLLLAAATALQGCCDDPEHQLSWEPDLQLIESKADWYDEDGLWQGNPSWKFSAEHEAEKYFCKTMHDSKPICVVWTVEEWNCLEHDFGVCKCHTLAEDGDYCQAWGCHSLEADQEVCKPDGEGGETCSYEAFPMTEERYQEMVARQASGSLTTGETIWWTFAPALNFGNNRRLDKLNGSSADAGLSTPLGGGARLGDPARRLQDRIQWPPSVAYNPVLRWKYWTHGEVCIANGDNVLIVKHQCSKWREVETEISQCLCTKGSQRACVEWYCEERDVGLFSVLYRTNQSIAQYTEGTEQENYTCTTFATDGACTAWEGTIRSMEEVEMTRCECSDSNHCRAPGAQWKCDEYELPRNQGVFHPVNRSTLSTFLVLEGLMVCGLCWVLFTDDADAFAVGMCCWVCMGVIIVPFLIVTFGLNGFLALSLPFWGLRLLVCLCVGAIACKGNCPGGSGDGPVVRADSGTLKRGASAIIGRKQEDSNSLWGNNETPARS